MNNKVEVRLFAYLRDGRGKRVYINANSVREIITLLSIDEKDAYIVLINGRDYTSLDDLINEGDIVSIFPQVGGG